MNMSRRPDEPVAKRYHPRRHPVEIMEWVCHPGYRDERAKALLRRETDFQGQMTGTSGRSSDIASQGQGWVMSRSEYGVDGDIS